MGKKKTSFNRMIVHLEDCIYNEYMRNTGEELETETNITFGSEASNVEYKGVFCSYKDAEGKGKQAIRIELTVKLNLMELSAWVEVIFNKNINDGMPRIFKISTKFLKLSDASKDKLENFIAECLAPLKE